MKCYNHSHQDSVGICKWCGRGLCHECLTQVEGSISCKGTCMERLKICHNIQNQQLKFGSYILMLIAFFLVISAANQYLNQGEILRPAFFFAIGVVMGTIGVYRLKRKLFS